MPANRSRTERWRDSLHQVYERGGALEVTIRGMQGADSTDPDPDLVWRVHVLGVTDDEIHIERPSALGQPIDLSSGTAIVAAMSIGQNRWMFHTSVVGTLTLGGARPVQALRLAMPDRVERCQRRHSNRISTAEIALPGVECWPLLDPMSVVPAAAANREHIRSLRAGGPIQRGTPLDAQILPEVGPRFPARLQNIGGGGAGLLVAPSDAAALDRSRLYWLRIDLTPLLPAPLALAAKLAHKHIDSAQNVYAGLAFDFGVTPEHKKFVTEQIKICAEALQQRHRVTLRKSA